MIDDDPGQVSKARSLHGQIDISGHRAGHVYRALHFHIAINSSYGQRHLKRRFGLQFGKRTGTQPDIELLTGEDAIGIKPDPLVLRCADSDPVEQQFMYDRGIVGPTETMAESHIAQGDLGYIKGKRRRLGAILFKNRRRFLCYRLAGLVKDRQQPVLLAFRTLLKGQLDIVEEHALNGDLALEQRQNGNREINRPGSQHGPFFRPGWIGNTYVLNLNCQTWP